jgi:hypothetical protein
MALGLPLARFVLARRYRLIRMALPNRRVADLM